MVGIVIVSHSFKLASGVLELAREMAGREVKLSAAGGMDLPDHPIGTDANFIAQAIEKVYSEDGVIVLMDLGSAVMSTEMAIEMLPADKRTHIALCSGPLVEGAVSAAVQARIGSSLEQIVKEAKQALNPKIDHLNPKTDTVTNMVTDEDTEAHILRITITNPLGLHARPAARFVQVAGRFPDTKISVRNLSKGKGPVTAKSINSVATLGVSHGDTIEISALGSQADVVLDAYHTLAEENFGDKGDKIDKKNDTETKNSVISLSVTNSSLSGSKFIGVSGSRGFAIGPARHFHSFNVKIPKNKTTDSQNEWIKLQNAIVKTRKEINAIREKTAIRTNITTSEIFDAHLLFLNDEALLLPAKHLIFEEKCNGADAWNRIVQQMAQKYRSLDDEYLRARVDDILDVGRQVILNFIGSSNVAPSFSSPGILIAHDLTPADTASLEPSIVNAICTAAGGSTSHSSILAKSLGIPAVVGIGEPILNVKEGDILIVDAEIGQVISKPDAKTIKLYTDKIEVLKKKEAKVRAVSTKAAITIDGKKIDVYANIGSSAETPHAINEGAEGIGLFRTEFLFLNRQTAPDEEEQFNVYCDTAKVMNGKPVIIRTLDIGGDKPIPYLNLESEANPFLGSRAIRMCLARPGFFKVQLRAIVRAASLFPIKVMFPMIATLDEFRSAKALLSEACDEVIQRGYQDIETHIDTGIMVEIPAAAICAKKLAPEVDFFSIGTNDLIQYTMAAERGNSNLVKLADPLHPAILELIYRVVESAHFYGKRVSVCGEAGGDPAVVPILIGLGVDELSMNSPSIPDIKSLIRSLDYSLVKNISKNALEAKSVSEVRILVSSLTDIGIMDKK